MDEKMKENIGIAYLQLHDDVLRIPMKLLKKL